jgi:hypothetical protein
MRVARALVALAVLTAAAIPSYAPAQVESTPIPAQAKPNFSSMGFMVGTWKCATKSARRPAPYYTTSTYSIDASGYWIYETSVTAHVPWSPQTIHAWDHITYDPDAKRWVDVLNADLGAYGLSFSKGWVGNQITWHDVSFAPGPDIASQTDTVTTKVSPTKMTSTTSFTETKTGRKVGVNTVCTKS